MFDWRHLLAFSCLPQMYLSLRRVVSEEHTGILGISSHAAVSTLDQNQSDDLLDRKRRLTTTGFTTTTQIGEDVTRLPAVVDKSSCVESPASRRSAEVLLFYKDGDEMRFAANSWGSGLGGQKNRASFLVFGNPTGTFYRRCLEPSELQHNQDCGSILLDDVDPETQACEGQSKASIDLDLEKGEEAALKLAIGEEKILNGNRALSVEDFGCASGLDMIECIVKKSKHHVKINLTPENVALAKPMHTKARLIEIPKPLANNLKIPSRNANAIGTTWISCQEATTSVETKPGKTQWKYSLASVVMESGLCMAKEPNGAYNCHRFLYLGFILLLGLNVL